MARAGGFFVQHPVLCLPPATGDLPETGGLVVSSPASPFRKPIEHAGHSYQQQLIRTYGRLSDDGSTSSGSESDKPDTATDSAANGSASRTHADDAAKSLKSKMAIGSEDLYELLELGDKRWHATADDIKKSFRRISLIYHPDKISHHGDEARTNSEAHFKAVKKAYDILSDKKKRAAYDSIDDVDDSIPSEKDATSSPARFYEKFGECFSLNARWSVSDRVPELGDDITDLDAVHRFYDFWYSFKSWRDFSFDLEYDVDQAECREEKRWMERQNAKDVKVKKLEENSRIRKLVDLAYKHDPRIVRAKRAVKAKKDAQKEERKRNVEEASKLAKEKEEKDRQEAERKAAEDKVKRAEAKKKKDLQRQKVRKARQKLRGVGRELQIMESEKHLIAVEDMCARGTVDSIETVTEALSSLSGNHKDIADGAIAILSAALSAPEEPVSSEKISRTTGNNKEAASSPTNKESSGSSQQAAEPLPNGNSDHIANGHVSEPRKREDLLWTQEELSLLSKGVSKFPGGTRDRWNRLAEYIGTRTADEVLRKVNESRPSKIKPGSKLQPVKPESDSNAFKRFQEKKKGKPVVPQHAPSKSSGARLSVASAQPPNKFGFTPKQQSLFEDALKKYPKSDEGRWKKVSIAVGRTPQHCQQRFDELIAYYSAKRASQQ